ncbi:hypothetical protein [Sphingomonas sp.]|uniref:hypothetical protein n=1 Tax=Sphingomonas sp. TaxID=28214 RepID=UPI003B3B4422
MAQFIVDYAVLIIAIGRACIAGAVVAGVLAFVWALDDLEARFRATLDDQGDEVADWGSEELHNDRGNAA